MLTSQWRRHARLLGVSFRILGRQKGQLAITTTFPTWKQGITALLTGRQVRWSEVRRNVCFGSKADIAMQVTFVRFVPCVDGSRLASQNFTSRRWSVQP